MGNTPYWHMPFSTAAKMSEKEWKKRMAGNLKSSLVACWLKAPSVPWQATVAWEGKESGAVAKALLISLSSLLSFRIMRRSLARERLKSCVKSIATSSSNSGPALRATLLRISLSLAGSLTGRLFSSLNFAISLTRSKRLR